MITKEAWRLQRLLLELLAAVTTGHSQYDVHCMQICCQQSCHADIDEVAEATRRGRIGTGVGGGQQVLRLNL